AGPEAPFSVLMSASLRILCVRFLNSSCESPVRGQWRRAPRGHRLSPGATVGKGGSPPFAVAWGRVGGLHSRGTATAQAGQRRPGQGGQIKPAVEHPGVIMNSRDQG